MEMSENRHTFLDRIVLFCVNSETKLTVYLKKNYGKPNVIVSKKHTIII